MMLNIVLLIVAIAAVGWGVWQSGSVKTAQLASQSESRAQQEENRALFENPSQGMALLDNRGVIVRANQTLHHLLGYAEGKLQGATLWELSDSVSQERAALNEVLSGQRAQHECDLRLNRRNGHALPVHLTLQTLPDASALAIIQETGANQQLEAELRQSRETIHDLYEVVAAQETSFADKMRALLDLGCRRFGLETGIVGRISGDSFEVMQAVSPDNSVRRGDKFPIGAGGQNAIAQQTGDWRDHPFYAATDSEAYLGAPIYVSGALYGTLNFGSRAPREAQFSASDAQLVKLMAQWAGSEIERRQARADLEAKQAELLEANAHLEALAAQDGLTGLKNRRAFNERLEMEVARAKRYGTPLSLLLMDVDKFKSYNDSFGHPAGDEVLKQVAQLLASGVRNIDFAARYGGEEFAVLLPNTDAHGAMILAERLRIRIETAQWPQREVTASFGAASLNDGTTAGPMLTQSADDALYQSKEAGRNRVTHAALKPSGQVL